MPLLFNTGALKYRASASDSWHPLVIKANMDWASLAEPYDPDEGTYEVGKYVVYNNDLYRCNTAITVPEAWVAAKWDSETIGGVLENFILIQDTQPIEETNRLWVKETTDSYAVVVPTVSDFEAAIIRGTRQGPFAVGSTLSDSEIACAGLTASHVVMNWGLFSDADCTLALSPNNPPADISIVEGLNKYTLSVSNVITAFYLRPVFILPQKILT